MRYVVGVIIGMIFMYYSMQPEPAEQVEGPRLNRPVADPNRIVDYYDWEHQQFVYKDTIKPKQRKFKPTNLDEVLPEMTIEVVTDDTGSPEPFFIKQNGQYYRVRYKPNHTFQIKPAR